MCLRSSFIRADPPALACKSALHGGSEKEQLDYFPNDHANEIKIIAKVALKG